MTKHLLVFSADPGGADCLAPLVSPMAAFSQVSLLAKGSGISLFRERGLEPSEFAPQTPEALEAMLSGTPWDGVVTSASSLPDLDMTEKWLWRWAERLGIPSVAVLDQWQNYLPRFSGPGGASPLGYLPSVLAVMDPHAEVSLVSLGIAPSRLVVTGHPGLEAFQHRLVAHAACLDRLRNPCSGEVTISFFSQPLRALFGDRLGYDEWTVLGEVSAAAKGLERAISRPVRVFLKLHPKQRIEKLPADALAGVTCLPHEASNEELLARSDLVLGIGSIMLIHAALAGLPTVSVNPRPEDDLNPCHAVTVGAIPVCRDAQHLQDLLLRLVQDPSFRARHLERQASLGGGHEQATSRVISLIRGVTRVQV